MSQVLKNESSMDIRVMELIHQLGKKCNTIFDIGPWTQWAAFDVAMEMISSDPVGFVKEGRDVDGLIASLHGLLNFVGIVGLYPWIAKLLYHPWLFPLIGPKPTDKSGPGAVRGFTYRQVARRLAKDAQREPRPDILQWILDHPDKEGQPMSRGLLEQEALGPVIAGSDTTASTLRAMILAVATNPRILNKLRQQIDDADLEGALSTPPTYEQLKQHVPYLEVLFKEAQRVYPIIGLPLFRAVAKSGAHINGHFLPSRTEVGIAQFAVGYNPHIYGEDVSLFRPERWSEDLSHDPVASKLRDNAEIWFGGGPMMCTGRNVAMLEVYKIITQFFRVFDVEVVNPARPWRVKAKLAVIQTDFLVKLTERKRPEELRN